VKIYLLLILLSLFIAFVIKGFIVAIVGVFTATWISLAISMVTFSIGYSLNIKYNA
jgi:hypothetical protein